MKNQALNMEVISRMQDKNQISFRDMVGFVVMERVLTEIGESEYSSHLWLRDKNLLNEDYRKKRYRGILEYDYFFNSAPDSSATGVPISRLPDSKQQAEVLAAALTEKNNYGIIWENSVLAGNRFVEVRLQAKIEQISIPFSLRLYPQNDNRPVPKHQEIRLISSPRKVTVYTYPSENLLSEYFIEIMQKLELIPDLKPYYEIYHLLTEDTIEGRKVFLNLEEFAKKNIQNGVRNQLPAILKYKKYEYMKKKWKSYLRKMEAVEPEWENVIGVIDRFYSPVWNACLENQPFIGDWMPELQRFLS